MSGTIRSMPPSQAYDEGWERTFGGEKPVARALRAWADYFATAAHSHGAEEAALRQLGGAPCEVCQVVVLERHFDSQKRLACATCRKLDACRVELAAPFQGRTDAAHVTGAAPEAPGAGGPGDRICRHCGSRLGGEPAAGEAAADGAADAAAAEDEPGAGAALGHAGGT